jgi:hypothetical protein
MLCFRFVEIAQDTQQRACTNPKGSKSEIKTEKSN